MERVLVIGSGGAGKSTLARQLGARFALPVVHLDQVFWQPGWRPTPGEAFRARVAELVAEERWVIEGNYSSTFDLRFSRCDTVVFLDMPRVLCLSRVLARAVRHRGEVRPDMAPGCPERMTLEFARWIWGYSRRARPRVMRWIEACDSGTRVIVLRAPVEVERFVGALGSEGR